MGFIQFPKELQTRRILFASLVLHLLAAFFSSGYHHYDEHYQILEWAGFKLGLTPVEALAWEYEAKIRPWFQPWIGYSVSSALDSVGLFNPFIVSLILRCLSALLGWWVTVGLVQCCSTWFPDPKVRKFAIYSTALIWFLPYLHARFSSENWSGNLFLLGLIPLVDYVTRAKAGTWDKKQDLLLGLWVGGLWALSFQSRYHAGIMILAAVLWWFRFAMPSKRVLGFSAAGFLVVSFLALSLDRWGYGQWTPTAWNYFRINVLEHKANEWGTEPFWFYFVRYFLITPPLSSLLLLGMFAGWYYARRFSLTWVTAAFVLVHCMIAHKELRFLFPILPAVPLLTAMALQKSDRLRRWFVERPYGLTIKTLCFFNFAFMVPLIFFPTRTEIPLMQSVWNSGVKQVYMAGPSPYSVPGVEAHFYRPKELDLFFADAKAAIQTGSYICLNPVLCREISAKANCIDLGGSMPGWLERYISDDLRTRAKILDWRLLRCEARLP